MKRRFLTKKKWFEKSVSLEKILEYLKIQETYSLKQAQSIIYLNENFNMFTSVLKDIIQAQVK